MVLVTILLPDGSPSCFTLYSSFFVSGKSSETCFGFEVMILFESMDTNNKSNNYQTSGGSHSPYF